MKQQTQQFMKNYSDFCDAVTSEESQQTAALMKRMQELEQQGCKVARLNTAQAGLAAEAGEFGEIVKKILFQGKPYTDDSVYHMKRELGDVMWYMMQACIALDLDLTQIIEENVQKLEKRYPGGSFDVWHSENRKEGDL